MPLAVLILEVVAGQVARDRRHGEVGVSAAGADAVRERVVLDPFRVPCIALGGMRNGLAWGLQRESKKLGSSPSGTGHLTGSV